MRSSQWKKFLRTQRMRFDWHIDLLDLGDFFCGQIPVGAGAVRIQLLRPCGPGDDRAHPRVREQPSNGQLAYFVTQAFGKGSELIEPVPVVRVSDKIAVNRETGR